MAGKRQKLELNDLSQAERNALVENHINLVWKYVHRIVKQAEYKEDAFQEGCLGLIRASQLYRPDRNAEFITFAAFEIQCAIRDYLYNNRIIRIPDSQRTSLNQYQTKLRQAEVSQGSLSGKEAEELKTKCSVSFDTAQAAKNIVSLDTPLNGSDMDETFDSLLDTIKDNNNGYADIELEELIQFCRDFVETAKDLSEDVQKLVNIELETCMESALGGLKPIKCKPHDEPSNQIETFISRMLALYPEWDFRNCEKNSPEYKEKYLLADRLRCKVNSRWQDIKKELQSALLTYGLVEKGQFAGGR